MSGFHIGRLLLSFFPRFLKAIYRRKNNFLALPYQIMHLLPGVVSCFRPNVPNLVFYGSGNVWWSGWCAAPGIDQHWNNGPAGNTICKLDFTAYIWPSVSTFHFHFFTIFELSIILFPAPGIDQHCNSGPACWEHNMQVRCCLLLMDCLVFFAHFISFDLNLGQGLKI